MADFSCRLIKADKLCMSLRTVRAYLFDRSTDKYENLKAILTIDKIGSNLVVYNIVSRIEIPLNEYLSDIKMFESKPYVAEILLDHFIGMIRRFKSYEMYSTESQIHIISK